MCNFIYFFNIVQSYEYRPIKAPSHRLTFVIIRSGSSMSLVRFRLARTFANSLKESVATDKYFQIGNVTKRDPYNKSVTKPTNHFLFYASSLSINPLSDTSTCSKKLIHQFFHKSSIHQSVQKHINPSICSETYSKNLFKNTSI